MSFSEAKTVERPILEWLTTPELGWRYESQTSVATHYRDNEIEEDITGSRCRREDG